MTMPAPQRGRQDLSYSLPGCLSPLPERALAPTSRVIKYVFLDGSQNIAPAHAPAGFESHAPYREPASLCYQSAPLPDWGRATAYWPPHLQRLPIFVTLSKSHENQACGGPLLSRDRLPVFRQLCGEVVQAGPHGNERDGGLTDADGRPKKPSKPEAPGRGEGRDEDGSRVAPSQ